MPTMTEQSTFNPDGPSRKDAGIYGLPHSVDEARVVVVPVPFEATVSYRAGTCHGPAAILSASHQVDLFDADVGRPYEPGIAMEDAPAWMVTKNAEARDAATRVIAALEEGNDGDAADLAFVEAAGDAVNAHVNARVAALLKAGKIPVVVGGDHSVPFGAITAVAEHLGSTPLGVLHLDAHCDLRDAYEGFKWSHASIMKNVLDATSTVKLTQLGIRDFSDGELSVVKAQSSRVTTYFDVQLRRARLSGGFLALAKQIAATLPEHVYLSFDIDGLDPALCPSTGTPVPGGLSFDEIVAVLHAVVDSGKRIVGLDLVEVAPPPEAIDGEGDDVEIGDSWDANVGARLLYKMIGFALRSQGVGVDPALPTPPGV
ncbi:MAG TPA: agmatinase [Myxococcota bacterium]